MHIQYENWDHQAYRLDQIADLNIVPHLHKHAEVIYLLEGSMTVSIDAHTRELAPGNAAFCFPNSVHSYATTSGSLAYILMFDIGLAGDFTKKLMKYIPADPFIPCEKVHPEVPECLRAMYAQSQKFYDMKDDADYGKLAIKGYIQVCIARLLAAMALNPAGDASEAEFAKGMLAYIMQNFKNSGLSLNQMAADLGVSAPYISHIFSKRIGIRYNDYLNTCRVQYARQLISDTDRYITDIAYESGFGDIRTFNRVFKKVTGLTPSESKE